LNKTFRGSGWEGFKERIVGMDFKRNLKGFQRISEDF